MIERAALAKRVSTGVAGLDAMLGGGFLIGDSTLVAGSPGTGKTTLGLQFLAAGVAAGQRGVFVTFEYLPQQLYRDAAKRGWPLEQWEREGKIKIYDDVLKRLDEAEPAAQPLPGGLPGGLNFPVK